MQNTAAPRNLKIAGFFESRSGRWYVTEDRTWKVRINDDNQATAIREGRDVYRLVGDVTYNTRTGRAVSPKVNVHDDVVEVVAQAREAERR